MFAYILTYNEHKVCYEKVETYYGDFDVVGPAPTEDSCYVLQVYPTGATGYNLWASAEREPLEKLLEEMK